MRYGCDRHNLFYQFGSVITYHIFLRYNYTPNPKIQCWLGSFLFNLLGLVTSCGIIEHGQHWFRQGLPPVGAKPLPEPIPTQWRMDPWEQSWGKSWSIIKCWLQKWRPCYSGFDELNWWKWCSIGMSSKLFAFHYIINLLNLSNYSHYNVLHH